jgi:hypothetical protein
MIAVNGETSRSAPSERARDWLAVRYCARGLSSHRTRAPQTSLGELQAAAHDIIHAFAMAASADVTFQARVVLLAQRDLPS